MDVSAGFEEVDFFVGPMMKKYTIVFADSSYLPLFSTKNDIFFPSLQHSSHINQVYDQVVWIAIFMSLILGSIPSNTRPRQLKCKNDENGNKYQGQTPLLRLMRQNSVQAIIHQFISILTNLIKGRFTHIDAVITRKKA